MAQLAGPYQFVQRPEDLRQVIHFRGRTMQLQQVNRVRVQVSQAALDERREVRMVVALRRLFRQPAPGLGGDVKRLLPLAAQFCQQPFTPPVAVNVRRVEEIHAAVQRGMERGERFAVVHFPPGAADGPRPKTDFGNFPAGASQFAIIHAGKLNEKGMDAKPQRRKAKIGNGAQRSARPAEIRTRHSRLCVLAPLR